MAVGLYMDSKELHSIIGITVYNYKILPLHMRKEFPLREIEEK